MTKLRETGDPAAEPLDEAALRRDLRASLVAMAWLSALRFALDGDGASARCARRSCRIAGRCCMSPAAGEPPSCGAGLTNAVLRVAVAHLAFACLIAEDLLDVWLRPER